MGRLTLISLVLGCVLVGLANANPMEYSYKTGYVNSNGVPSGPMDLQPPTFQEMKNFGTSKSGDAMENIFSRNTNLSSDGLRCFIEGDIPVPCDQINSTRVRRNALRDRGMLWRDGVVPYVIDNRYDYDTRSRIQRAFDRYHATTCIRFVQRTTQTDFISIFPGSGCWSLVGRVGGMQQVSLGTGCTTNLGTIVHEFMHAIGFQHEQTRADRDDFVYIYRQNIIRGLEYNFDKYGLDFIDHLGTNYDYFSVMHYHMTAFTANGQPTIVARDQRIRLDYRSDFSANDIRKINLYYSCDTTVQPTDAPDPTNPDPDCTNMNQYCDDWAAAGHCTRNPEWMNANCPVSCDQCTGTGTGGGNENCADMNDSCEFWASIGECDANPTWMRPNCPVSCDTCETTTTDDCLDKNDNCALWARYDQCTINPGYMLENCAKSCGQCSGSIMSTCQDFNENCANWAANDQCELNPGYMNYQCRKSCSLCAASSPLELVPQVQCVDSNGYCEMFAEDGMCISDAKYMNLICPRSCGMCPEQYGIGAGNAVRSSLAGTALVMLIASVLSRYVVA